MPSARSRPSRPCRAPIPRQLCNGKSATIVGQPGAVAIRGTQGADVIVGLGGDVRIEGRGGNDTICAGDGDNIINGGAGNDWIDAGDGANTVDAGAGNDTIYGGTGDDTILGGTGNDNVVRRRRRQPRLPASGDDEIVTGPATIGSTAPRASTRAMPAAAELRRSLRGVAVPADGPHKGRRRSRIQRPGCVARGLRRVHRVRRRTDRRPGVGLSIAVMLGWLETRRHPTRDVDLAQRADKAAAGGDSAYQGRPTSSVTAATRRTYLIASASRRRLKGWWVDRLIPCQRRPDGADEGDVMTRFLRTAVAAGILAIGAVAPVSAASPSNDDIANPIVIGALPATVTVDASEATTGATDPGYCPAPEWGQDPATVWFEHTATSTGPLGATTYGSDYPTTLYVGTSNGNGGLDVVGCATQSGGTAQSAVRFEAEAGVKYLFAVGLDPNFGEPAGNLEFNLDLARP